MALFSFFGTTKNQQFKYIPRHWDPLEEERKERLEYLEGLRDNSPEAVKERLAKGGFKRGYSNDPKLRKNLVNKSNKILFGVILILLFLVYYFLNFYLPKLIESLEGSQSFLY